MFGILGILAGILCILVGGFLVFMFPHPTRHQPEQMGIVGIVLGFILLIIGFVLVFMR